MNSADKQYQDLLKKILETGRIKGDRTGTGTISIPFATLDFDMSEGFPLLTTKKVFTKAIIHELLWFLNGDTNIKYLEDNGVTIWTSDAYREYNKKVEGLTDERLTKENFSLAIRNNPEFAKKFGELGPVYGRQWRHWNYLQWTATDKVDPTNGKPILRWEIKGIDQVKEAMDKLINNPDDRRIMVSAWNVDEIPHMALPPCHYGFQLYTEELTETERWEWLRRFSWENNHTIPWDRMAIPSHEWFDGLTTVWGTNIPLNIPKRKISLIWDQRSCDTFLGIPFNIASYSILLHMFAQQANMVPDRLIGSLKNVHVYLNHIEQCKEQISREPRELPKLSLVKAPDLFSYKYSDIKIENYNPHETIKGDISV